MADAFLAAIENLSRFHREHVKNELRAVGEGSVATGAWLSTAMEGTWGAASALVEYPALADLVGDRHRIIANDWHAASMSSLAGHVLQRSAEILDTIDFTPAALRADLDGPRIATSALYSAVELIDHAADLLSDSAGLVHDNERRWRGFHRRIAELTQDIRGDERRR